MGTSAKKGARPGGNVSAKGPRRLVGDDTMLTEHASISDCGTCERQGATASGWRVDEPRAVLPHVRVYRLH